MKKTKNLLLLEIFVIALLVLGCGKQVSSDSAESSVEESSIEESDVMESTVEESSVESIFTEQATVETESDNVSLGEEMSSDFYYVVEDTFSLEDSNDLVVVGVVENSTLFTGAQVDILSENGRIQTQVLAIEVADLGIVDSAESGTNAGVMLENVTQEQIKAGDLLVLRNQGMIADKACAFVAMLPIGDDQTFVQFSEGQNVQVIMFDEPVGASVTYVETVSEDESGDIVLVELEFEEDIAFQDYQMLVICDESGNSIAAGRFVFDED